MKIILTSIGTRGDMEPFLAIGEILKKEGHHVICLFPEQFRSLAADSGLEFESLGSGFLEMLGSPAGKTVMSGGKFGYKKLKAIFKLISIQKPINKEMVLKQESVITQAQPDRIVHNGKVIYPVVWSLGNKGKTVLVSPIPYMHYVKDQAHIVFNRNFGPIINKMTYQLANFGLLKTIMGSIKWLSMPRKIKQREIQRALFSNKCVYAISPTLFTRPSYWKENYQVLGYYERKKTNNWKPTPELDAFIEKHSKIILVTFGSMINSDPKKKTDLILEILEKNNISAIINTASGGLVQPAEYNSDLFHFVTRIPYDWVFPKMYAVIHHGGSGTTHTALKYGCSTLIIPHIIDQYVWNKLIHKKGAGPLGKDVSRINKNNLEPLVIDLLDNPSYRKRAEELGNQMNNENYSEELCHFIVGN